MKKMIFLIVLMSITKISLLAVETPPCWPDCPMSAWTKTYLDIPMSAFDCTPPPILGCGNPQATVEFWHRHAECDSNFPPGDSIIEYDCQITKVTFNKDTNDTCWNNCLNNKSIFDLYKIALKKVIEKMVQIYPKNAQNEIWRVVNVPCWGRLTVDGKEVLQYCNIEDPVCCWKKYQKDANGNYHLIEAFQAEGPPPTCYLWTYPCYYLCNNDNLEEEPPPPPPVVASNYEELSTIKLQDFNLIRNQFLDKKIEIFDLQGNLLSSATITNNINSIFENLEYNKIIFFQIIDVNGIILKRCKVIF